MDAPRVFVSHSQEDAAYCHVFVAELINLGADVWYDEQSLGSGELTDVIQRELDARPNFIVVLSKSAFASQWVRRECKWAYGLADSTEDRLILPVVAEPITDSDFSGKSGWLFMKDFHRVEGPQHTPLAAYEAARKAARILGLAVSDEAPASVAESAAQSQTHPPNQHNAGIDDAGSPYAAPMPDVLGQWAAGATATPAAPPPAPAQEADPPSYEWALRHSTFQPSGGEHVLRAYYQHWLTLTVAVARVLAVIAIAIAVVAWICSHLLSISFDSMPLAVGLALVGLLVGCLIGIVLYERWDRPVLILTSWRIVGIKYHGFFPSESRFQATYERVQDIQVSRSAPGALFGFGSLSIEAYGTKLTEYVRYLPRPFEVQDTIFKQIAILSEEKARAARQARAAEFDSWVGGVMQSLVTEVPDIRGLPFIQAAERLREVGLRLMVTAERPARGVVVGTVVEQTPSAGATALIDSEVTVVLAGREG